MALPADGIQQDGEALDPWRPRERASPYHDPASGTLDAELLRKCTQVEFARMNREGKWYLTVEQRKHESAEAGRRPRGALKW
jgi:hypothetical protein